MNDFSRIDLVLAFVEYRDSINSYVKLTDKQRETIQILQEMVNDLEKTLSELRNKPSCNDS